METSEQARNRILQTVREARARPTERIRLSEIRTDAWIHARVGTDVGAVREDADAVLDGDERDPVVVFRDGKVDWLSDGYLRFSAQTDQAADIECIVAEGTPWDAKLYASYANARHGERLSQADRRRLARQYLEDGRSRDWSAREIASWIGSTHKTVRKVANEMEASGEIPQTTEKLCADGRTRDVSGIALANRARAAATAATMEAGSPGEAQPTANPRRSKPQKGTAKSVRAPLAKVYAPDGTAVDGAVVALMSASDHNSGGSAEVTLPGPPRDDYTVEVDGVRHRPEGGTWTLVYKGPLTPIPMPPILPKGPPAVPIDGHTTGSEQHAAAGANSLVPPTDPLKALAQSVADGAGFEASPATNVRDRGDLQGPTAAH